MSDKFLYTKKKIAAYLDVSVPTLMRFIDMGAPVVKDKDGNAYWTLSDTLLKWYNEHLNKELAKIHTKKEG